MTSIVPSPAGVPQSTRTCAVCLIPTEKRCSGCKTIYYCSIEHQRQAWKEHKIACEAIRSAPASSATLLPRTLQLIYPVSPPLQAAITQHMHMLTGFSSWKMEGNKVKCTVEKESDGALIASKIGNISHANIFQINQSYVVQSENIDIHELLKQNSICVKKPEESVKSELHNLFFSLSITLSLFNKKIYEDSAAWDGPYPIRRVNQMAFLKKFDWFHPQTVSITAPNMGQNDQNLIVKIKMNKINLKHIQNEGKKYGIKNWPIYFLAVTWKTKETIYYFVKSTPSTVTDIETMKEKAALLHLVEFPNHKQQMILYENILNTPTKLEYWNNWEDRANGGLGIYYDRVSDPLIIEAFTSEVLSFACKDKPIKIIELAAGKCRLAKKLLEIMNDMHFLYEYIVVEPNKTQMKTAKSLLSTLPPKGSSIQFIEMDMDSFITSFSAPLKNSADCVISSGGPFNVGIVSSAKAKNYVKKTEAMLGEEGIFILGGLSCFLVEQEDFTLTPLSCAAPVCLPPDLSNHPFLQEVVARSAPNNYWPHYIFKKTKPPQEAPNNEILSAASSAACASAADSTTP